MANAGLHDLSIIVGTCLEGFVAEMRTLNIWTTVRRFVVGGSGKGGQLFDTRP